MKEFENSQLIKQVEHLKLALEKIANGAHPYNEREAFSFVETAKAIADDALKSQVFIHSLPTADDNTYLQIINYGLQWGGKNPLGWKTGQDVVDYAKSKHQLLKEE